MGKSRRAPKNVDVQSLSAVKQKNLAINEGTDPQILAQLAEIDDHNITASVAANRNAPDEVLSKLVCNSDVFTHLAAAHNRSLTTETITKLIKEHDVNNISSDALITLMKHPNLGDENTEHVLQTFKDNVKVLAALALNYSINQKFLVELASPKHNAQVRRSVALNSVASDELLHTLSYDEDVEVRAIIAERVHLLFGSYEHLLDDDNQKVLKNLLNNHTMSQKLLQKAWDRYGEFEWARKALSKNPGTPPDVLTIISENFNYSKNIAMNPASPVEALFNAYRSGDEFAIKYFIIGHNNCEDWLKEMIELAS